MITVCVQAGGQSRRMGQDKALLPFLGQPLISRVIARLRTIADEMIVTTNRPEAYAFLGLPLFSDLIPNRGALGGLYTALMCASQPVVAVVACDMPFVSAPLLAYACEVLIKEAADVVVPQNDEGQFEPLHAVYRRAACLPPIRTALDDGAWKVIAWFAQVKVRVLSAQEIAPYDPSGLAFSNVNTPEELHRAQDLARQLG